MRPVVSPIERLMQAPRQARLECSAAPAPGFRDAMSTRGFGGLRDVGSTGYSWSSSIAGTDTHGLGFGYNGVNPQYYSNRANGLQLRCLQEHPEGVLLGFSQPNLNRACQARKFVLGRGAARHSNRAASTPGRGRRCFAPRPAQPKARPGFPYDGRRHPRRKAAIRRSTRRDCVSAGVGRNTFDPQQTAIVDRASRRHPARRELLGGARSSFRWRRPAW